MRLALDRDTISKKKVTAVIRAVGRWKLLAELFCTETNLEKIEDMNEELQQLLAGIGGMTRRVNRGGSKKKTCTSQ
jgi:TATA-binding protein-associated factor